MTNNNINIFKRLIICAITGIFSALIITLFKGAAHFVVDCSYKLYDFLSKHLILIIPYILLLYFAALLLARIYKKHPHIKGGGIPSSIAAARGFEKIKWLSGLIGSFILPLFSFLVGVPLGTEGPSVQMGACAGGAVSKLFCKQEDKQAIGAGAASGFGVATCTPVAAVAFAFEEIGIGFKIIKVLPALVSVTFAYFTMHALSLLFGTSVKLFEAMPHIILALNEVWIPAAVGVCVGIFAVLFLRFYKMVFNFCNTILCKVKLQYKIFAVLALTVLLGVCSVSFISTGHGLIEGLFEHTPAVIVLILILLVRSVLSIGANANGITGGMFLPTIALGAVLALILGLVFGLDPQYFSIIIMLGITSAIAGFMKMPIAAIIFTVEAFGCYANILHVLLAALTSFVIVKFSKTNTLVEYALEGKITKK
ncbi:MAG: chloride channel protein [Clostridia bacterium]|nr:chloride channel protein [Clostridia bacterium]